MINATRWKVPAEHPVFAGHFPDSPILPGVMLLDTALHSIAVATGIALDACKISSVKFLSPANPGDELVIRHAISDSGTIRFDISAVAGSRKIASGTVEPVALKDSGIA